MSKLYLIFFMVFSLSKVQSKDITPEDISSTLSMLNAQSREAQDECDTGVIYLRTQDYKSALQWFNQAAKKGNIEAQNRLGRMYSEGLGVSQSDKEAMFWYLQAAKQGDMSAQNKVAEMYIEGLGTGQSMKEAIFWYGQAAKKGNADAQYNLALIYEKGKGVKLNDKEARYWLNQAAEQGHVEAQYKLATRYDEGRGFTQSDESAKHWYTRAAENGHADAAYNLAMRYDRGKGVKKDDKASLRWLKRAAQKGHREAQNKLAKRKDKGKDLDDTPTFDSYMRAAERGDAQAQHNVGLLYSTGYGVKQDDKEALRWLDRAARGGDVQAQYDLGVMYDKGDGVKQNDREAFKWFHQAAKQGDAQAQYNVGLKYLEGKGVKQSDEDAFKWLSRVAHQGNAQAQSDIGLMYLEGRGVKQNDREALQWLRQAAEQGHAFSQYSLAQMYRQGQGTKPSQVQSNYWFNQATRQGRIMSSSPLGIRQRKALEPVAHDCPKGVRAVIPEERGCLEGWTLHTDEFYHGNKKTGEKKYCRKRVWSEKNPDERYCKIYDKTIKAVTYFNVIENECPKRWEWTLTPQKPWPWVEREDGSLRWAPEGHCAIYFSSPGPTLPSSQNVERERNKGRASEIEYGYGDYGNFGDIDDSIYNSNYESSQKNSFMSTNYDKIKPQWPRLKHCREREHDHEHHPTDPDYDPNHKHEKIYRCDLFEKPLEVVEKHSLYDNAHNGVRCMAKDNFVDGAGTMRTGFMCYLKYARRYEIVDPPIKKSDWLCVKEGTEVIKPKQTICWD